MDNPEPKAICDQCARNEYTGVKSLISGVCQICRGQALSAEPTTKWRTMRTNALCDECEWVGENGYDGKAHVRATGHGVMLVREMHRHISGG